MKTRFLKYTFLLAAFLWSVAAFAQNEISIQTHPHYESACAGSSTTFTVAATGGNLSYQWYGFTGQGVEALNDGGIYSGTNTPALQISEVSVEMNKRYFFCKISNDSQETRTTSATIRLKNLLINNQPRDRSVYAGDNAIFRMDASGDNIKFQWQRKQDGVFTNLTDGKSYNGVDLSVLIVKEVEAADNASEFRCVVTGGDACLAGSLTTESAVLNVKEGLNPVKSMSLLPAETVLTLDNEIVTFSNGTEVTVWGSVVVQGDNGQFSYYNTTNSDEPELEITGSLTNNNTADELFQEDDKTIVTFSGNTPESILGNGFANNFYSLIVNKTNGASLSLENSPNPTTNTAASVATDLIFSSGNLDLKNNDLELLPSNLQTLVLLDNTNVGTMPKIVGESDATRIIASEGEVFMDILVGNTNPFSTNATGYELGNMGLNINTDVSNSLSADELTIRRGHNETNIGGNQSIDKYYKVIRSTSNPNPNADVDITIDYFDDEAIGQDINNLSFYYNPNTDGTGTFTNEGTTTNSPNLAYLENVNTLAGTWTLQTCIAPELTIAPGINLEMCFGADPITLIANDASGTAESYLWQIGVYDWDIQDIVFTTIPGETSNTLTVEYSNPSSDILELYRVIAVNADGCKGQADAYIQQYQQVDVDWSALPIGQCGLSPFIFDASWSNTSAGYQWYVNGEQQTGEASSIFNFTPDNAGTYEVEVITGNSVEGSFICPETFTHTITFNDQPLSFSFPYEFEQVNLCGDEQVTLTPENITPADDGSYTYEWFTEDDTEIILSNSPTLTVGEGTAYGDEQYLLRITTDIGCFDLQLVTVYTTPIANLDWSGLQTVQCDLSPFTFDADWGYEFAVYQWSVDNVLQASETGAQFNFTPPAAGTYEISVTTGEDDFEGGIVCPTTFTHSITFSEEPVNVSFPYAFSEVDVCEAEGLFTLTPDLTPADNGSYTYSWTLAGVEVGTAPTYTITFDAAIETETYQLTVTTGAGCTDIESVLVYHTESADVDWSALPETVCTLDPYTFDADWGNVGAGFQWNVDDAIQTGETASTFVFTPPAAGTYTISVITGEYGSIQYCPEQFTHTITFADGEQLADLPFSITACDVEGELTPVDLETPACTGCTYQWLDANDNPVGTNSNTYTVPDLTQNTSYSVEVTKDGCTSTDEVSLFYYFVAIDETATVVTGIGCDGAPTGAIDLVYDATEFGYSEFLWENVNTGDTYDNEDLTGLAAGTYSVTINDNLNGCIDTATFIVGGSGETVSASSVVVQPDCFGDDNGSITLTPSGGTGTYTYAWSNGLAPIAAVTDLSPDNYSVTISDGNDCEYTEDFVILQPVVLQISLAKTDLDCADGADGTITVTTTGGTEPYTYVWSPNANNPIDPENLTGLSAGTYVVTVTDDRNCEATTGITIEEPANAIAANFATTTGISCNNANDGFISINASGGTGDLTYDWNVDTYDGMNEVSNLPAGMYSISVSDANGCPPVVLEITFDNPAPLTVSDVIINPTAAGAMDGNINISVAGGTPNYNYDWADVPGLNNEEDRTGLGAGTYTVVITDENDCEITEQYQLTEPGQISVILGNIMDVSCTGTNDGTIDITVNGGVSPYIFLWSNGDETEDLANVPAGDYTVMITDNNGIEFNSLTYTVNPPNFLTNNAIVTQIDCSGETGIIALSPTNGTGDFTYEWAHGPTTATVSDLAAGDYTVTISTDNDCPLVGNYTINAAPTEITISGTATGVCAGNADGTIDIDVTGGTPDYTFIWTNTADNSTVALTEDVMNLPAGDYQVEVTDDNNCVATFDLDIPEYPSLDGSADVTDVSAGGATDGAIDLTITGGTEAFTFTWSNDDGFMADTEDISDLSVGTYTVLVTDANDCTFTASYTVNEPGALDIVLNVTQNIACFGEETGQITATIGGGTEPYTYAWSNGGTVNPLTDLPAGTYTLTATDDAGIVTVSNPITIDEPSEFTINAQVTNPTTVGGNDGSILTVPTGGEAPYTFNWSDGTDTYSTSSLTNIGAGNYDLTVTDANGCTATDALATYTLTDPNVLSISLTASQNVSCPEGADGSLTVSASGGIEEYSYNWENAANPGTSIGATATIDALEAGAYNVTAMDADGLTTSNSFDITQPEAFVFNEMINNVLCDNPMSGSIALAPTGGTGTYTYLWSNAAITASITDLAAGDYSVTITDENDCTYTETFTIIPASLISAMETIINVNCNGDNTGSLNIEPQGGGGTYTYLWSNEATTQSISQLTAGEYSVTISDGGACTFTETYTIEEPTDLTASTTTMQASQPTTADGSIDLTVNGGTGAYTFLWSNNETTEDIENILPSTYSVTITDANNCELVETVSVTSPGGLSVIPTVTQMTCFGLDNGSISLEIEGGTMPFTILWSNDETTMTISDLEAGIYDVTVTDDTGFSVNTSAEIIEPAEFSLTATPTGVACNGDENGSINLTTNNGQSDFDFVWSNEATTQNISALEAGVYMVTATDNNGCIATQTAIVSTPSPLVLIEDVIENPNCWDDTNGTIFLSTTGGTGDYDYLWSNGGMLANITGLSPDTYFVTVTDENNCTAEMSYEVTAPLPILISFDETNIACGGATVGSITATIVGGTTATGDYDLMWSNGETTLTINDLTAGNYTLTAEDDNNCSSIESTEITQSGSLTLNETQENITCFGEEDGIVLIQVEGGNEPFEYNWSNGNMTDLATGLAAQDYTVTVTDADGCEGVETYIISQPTPMIGTLDALAASCFDSENGAIELTVSGGTLEAGNEYSFSWSNGEMSQNISALLAGEYTVIITDDNDCTLTETETVLAPDEIEITALQGGTDCGNTDNISITLEVTGGTPDYLYNWDTGATTATIENLAEGTYMATVTDDNGCTQNIEQSVFQPEPIVADAFIQRAGCKTADDGLIDVTTTGGLAPYDFAWSTGSFEEDVLGLSAGNYSVTITDATNCVHEMNFEIETAPEPFAVNFLVNSGLSDTDTLQVNSSDIVQFIDVTLPTPTAWEWSFGDPNNSTSTEQNPQFSYPFDEDLEQTEYMASLVASNEYCRDTVTKTILIINNFRPNIPTFDPGENVRFLNVNAYPNPTDDLINLDIEMSKEVEVKVQIVDVLGRIHEERTLTEDDMYNTQFSMKNLTNGVYYLHLSSADRKVTLAVVKVE